MVRHLWKYDVLMEMMVEEDPFPQHMKKSIRLGYSVLLQISHPGQITIKVPATCISVRLFFLLKLLKKKCLTFWAHCFFFPKSYYLMFFIFVDGKANYGILFASFALSYWCESIPSSGLLHNIAACFLLAKMSFTQYYYHVAQWVTVSQPVWSFFFLFIFMLYNV